MYKASIVIATYNRCAHLSQALESIMSQDIHEGSAFEIVVIDNNSTDETRRLVRDMSSVSPVSLKYFFEARRGKGFALNRGIQEARGEFIVFTDDDIVADPKWLWNIVECFERHDCDCVGGRVVPDYPWKTPQWIKDNAQELVGPIVRYDYGEEVRPFQKKAMYEFLGANFAFKKDVFDEVGMFLTDIGPGRTMMGEDTEILNRLLAAGKSLYYCGQALIRHPVDPKRMTFRYIARWNISLGSHRVRADEKSMPSHLKYMFGFPSYLLKVIVRQAILLFVYLFNRKKFLRTWIELFINVGKAKQIRLFHSELERGVLKNELFYQCDHLHV